MSRASLPQRIWLALSFAVAYVLIILFKDIPRVLLGRKKKIENQVVVITGGAMGIGKQVATQLSLQHHAKVCILDVNEIEGRKTVEELTAAGGQAFFFQCDISNHKNLEQVASSIYQDPKLGRVHILVANAAILKFGEVLDLTVDDYKKNSDVNILGHIYTVKTFLPKMVDQRNGHIVTVGSICSHYGEYCGTAYCTAKFAIRGFTEALQMELYEKGLKEIVLTSIYPYFVKTNFLKDLEEPYSSFFNVLSVERCSNEIVDSILKERMTHFIPGGIGPLCTFLKCLITKGVLPYGRKTFNFVYKQKPLSDVKFV